MLYCRTVWRVVIVMEVVHKISYCITRTLFKKRPNLRINVCVLRILCNNAYDNRLIIISNIRSLILRIQVLGVQRICRIFTILCITPIKQTVGDFLVEKNVRFPNRQRHLRYFIPHTKFRIPNKLNRARYNLFMRFYRIYHIPFLQRITILEIFIFQHLSTYIHVPLQI